MKIARKDVYAFYGTVGSAQFDLPIKTAFRYMLSKNLKKSKAEIDETDALFPAPAGYEEYFNARAGIFGEFGIGVAQNGAIDTGAIAALTAEQSAGLNDKLEKLIANNKEMLEQVSVLNDEKLKFLDEMIEIDMETVKLDDVPTISEKNGDLHWEIWRLLELVVVK